MSEKPFALSTISPPSLEEEEGDYDAICATVMESARGRWFLEEYARRNRNADTKLVLAAIERIESLIRGDRSQQAYHGLRAELLEMAKAIAETRAEDVGEPEAGAQGQPAERDAKRQSSRSEILAMAERLHDVAWTMRERGLDPATCEEIETLASSILAASSLQDPADHRAQKLKEVLQYLERRIGSMLDAGAQAGPMLPEGLAENETRADNSSASGDAALDDRFGQDAGTNETVASDNGDVRPVETGHAAWASDTADPPVAGEPWQSAIGVPADEGPGSSASLLEDTSKSAAAQGGSVPIRTEARPSESCTLQGSGREAGGTTVVASEVRVEPHKAGESGNPDSGDPSADVSAELQAFSVPPILPHIPSELTSTGPSNEVAATQAEAPAAVEEIIALRVTERTIESFSADSKGAATEIEIEPLVVDALGDRKVIADTAAVQDELVANVVDLPFSPVPDELLSPAGTSLAAAASFIEATSEATPSETGWPTSAAAGEASLEAAEIDLPPLLATAVELPSDASDSPGELQLDPLVIEPPPAAVATRTSMSVVASEASSLIEPLVPTRDAPSADQFSDAISPELSVPPASPAAAEASIPLGEQVSSPAVPTNETAPQVTVDWMAQSGLPAAPAAPLAADRETVDAETVDANAVEALEENMSAAADAPAAAITALMPNRQSEIGAAVECEPAEILIKHGDVDRSDGDEPAAITPELCEATAADGRHVVLDDTAREMVAPVPSRSEQSTATSDPPAAKAAIASEDKTESSEERPAEHAAASPPRAIDIVHDMDDLPEPWATAVSQPQAEAAATRLAQQEPFSTGGSADVLLASTADSSGAQPASIPVSPALAEALPQAALSVDPQNTASETAVLAPSPFEQSGLADEPSAITPIASEANAEAPKETPAEAPAETSAEPVPTAPPAPYDVPHEDILSGAWELAVSQPQAEAAATLPVQQERLSPGQISDVLVESKLDIWDAQPAPGAASVVSEEPSLDPILDIEQELFVPAPIVSPREIVAEHFLAAPAAELLSGIPRADAPPSPTIAAAPVERIAVAPATTPIQPAMAAAPAAPARPMARPMPRAAPSDPLAALKAMTDEERIALFT